MTNIAQMVNVLQSMIITDKDKMVLTPTYYAYQMYAPFQGATSLPLKLDNNPQYALDGKSIPEISASAARGADGKLYLALVNTNPGRSAEVALNIPGQSIKAVKGNVLTADAMDTHNTFKSPQAIKPASFSAAAGADGKLTVKVPAKAVIVVSVE
jgi:alpha-N-arabinofuranosidase